MPEEAMSLCTFCLDTAVLKVYRDILLCRWHLTHFYLGLELDWSD